MKGKLCEALRKKKKSGSALMRAYKHISLTPAQKIDVIVVVLYLLITVHIVTIYVNGFLEYGITTHADPTICCSRDAHDVV